VLHLDYEQGARLTSERYQRLARALGIAREELRGRLEVAVHPGLYTDDRDAEDRLLRELDGVDLVLIDAYAPSAPTVDENSSESRKPLDMLARVSEKTGAVAVVIHHARKPSKEQVGGARTSIRGSSALFDASGSVFVFSGEEKNGPIVVSHEKCRARGVLAPDFSLLVEDVEVDGDPRAGLRVRVVQRSVQSSGEDAVDADADHVLSVIVGHPGVAKAELRRLAGRSNPATDAAVERLLRTGRIEERPNGRRRELYAIAAGGGA
jgi:hypothetical protein